MTTEQHTKLIVRFLKEIAYISPNLIFGIALKNTLYYANQDGIKMGRIHLTSSRLMRACRQQFVNYTTHFIKANNLERPLLRILNKPIQMARTTYMTSFQRHISLMVLQQ